MRVEDITLIEKQGYVYKVVVAKRKHSVWKFWDNSEQMLGFVGNQIGWYDEASGAMVGDKALANLLNNAARKQQLDEMVQTHNKSQIKPVK